MSEEILMRGFFAGIMSAAVGWAVYDRSARETEETLAEHRQRYGSMGGALLPLYVLLIWGASSLHYGGERSLHMMLSLCFGIFLHISIYYVLLLLALPLLRRYLSARACALLWLLPNFLYLTQHSFMAVPRPLWVLRLDGRWMECLAGIWVCGFAGVLGWKLVSHVCFRRHILRSARPVDDPAVLAIWQAEQERTGAPACELRLVRSPAVTTPLSIGFFRRTIRVVLPERTCTPEELTLIFRHELVHIGREDSGNKLLLVFCTAMCWFNPMMWAAMRRSADDLELSCDETVLREADEATRSRYAQLLLSTAGDERGFTTCLSASASALRYRLTNVVQPRRRLTGGVAVGLVTFALIMSCGYAALAYDGATGREYIFTAGDCADYQISDLSRRDEDGYRFYICTDEAALGEYLAALPLYRMTGNFSTGGDYRLSAICQGPGERIVLTLREYSVTVTRFQDEITSETYYCAEELDWDWLDTLLVNVEDGESA